MNTRIDLLSVQDVIDRLYEKIEDLPAMSKRWKAGEMEEYYRILVDETSSEILNVPVDRICRGLEAIEDEDETEDQVNTLADIIAEFFNKDPEEVTHDICESIEIDADRDLRIARLNRYANKLH